ncbi:MAG: cation:proton antiporter, partial [Cycloclasticus sp.]|nr:cation:proton antiporter [Cycloclasticus sp.]
LAVVPMLALVSLLAMPTLSIGDDVGIAIAESLAILAVVILTGRYFLHPILHRIALTKIPEVFTASAILIVLGVSLIAEEIGLSMAMGAFVAGMLMSDSSYKHQVVSEIKPFRGLLLGLFFMSMGMSLNLGLLLEKPLLSLGLVATLIAVKIILLFPLVYMFGLSKGKSLAVAVILAQSGEFALVLFSLSVQSGVLDTSVHQQLLLVILLSLLITPALASWAQRILNKNKSSNKADFEQPKLGPTVIAGFGRVGHRVGDILTQAGQPFVAIDIDPSIVNESRAKGHPVFYGDVCDKALLDSVGAEDTSTIIITINDIKSSKLIVSSLRTSNPDLLIYVRGQNSSECIELQRLGASGVVSENIEASIELARMSLTVKNTNAATNKNLLENYAKEYYKKIKLAIK